MITKAQYLLSIGETEQTWSSVLNNVRYYDFKIKKPASKMRHIEAPVKELKLLQKKLATTFNLHYKNVLPSTVFGYIPKYICPESPRDIRTNALCHVTQQYLLNIDLKDFFHQIKIQSIESICTTIGFEPALVTEVSLMTTKDGRLPMGAPTSPVLSNWASLSLDQHLIDWARENELVYTRYVDDLCFSGMSDFSRLQNSIFSIITQNGFKINAQKIKYYYPEEIKTITGIDFKDINLSVNTDTIEKIKNNIRLLKKVVHAGHLANAMHTPHKLHKDEKLKAIRRSIEGQIQFVKRVEDKDSSNYQEIKKLFKKAITPEDHFEFTFYI
jgi:RNA-directed DNA polymerase